MNKSKNLLKLIVVDSHYTSFILLNYENEANFKITFISY